MRRTFHVPSPPGTCQTVGRVSLGSVGDGRPDLVLDPFCGGGTTGVACARHGRRFVGFDLMMSYLELAVARLRDEVNSNQLELTFGGFAVETIWIEAENLNAHHSPTRAEIVSNALRELGGEGYLREINRLVERSPRTRENRTWPSTVRRVVRQSARFEPVGRGRYRLRYESLDARTVGAEL
ncbi:MAG TPA: DNA methyltransferase [Pyrinomonadaceae bacterium]|nr:DNA methyltransferase [Pyrinomonadaceae bacterium]